MRNVCYAIKRAQADSVFGFTLVVDLFLLEHRPTTRGYAQTRGYVKSELLFLSKWIWGIHQALLVRCGVWLVRQDIRQTELHNAMVQATYARHFRTMP
jgi:hypothetical protein